MADFDPFEVSLIRGLKKSAIIVLIMLRLRRPTGEVELSEILAIDRKTARARLRELHRIGFVNRVRHREGWTLTTEGRQLFLGEAKISPYRLTTTANLINAEVGPESEVVDSPAYGEFLPIEAERLEILQAARFAGGRGIGRSVLAELVRDPHYSPAELRRFVSADAKLPVALVIHKLREHDPAPAEIAGLASCAECGAPDPHHNRGCAHA